MVEQGIVAYIQAGLGTPPLAPGGFAAQLPKDQISASSVMAWCYRSIESDPSYLLNGQDGVDDWHIVIDCHGYTMAFAIQLAAAIDGVMRGAPSVTLTDPNSTFVQGIFRTSQFVDGYSDLNRSFVRTVEYRVIYNQI